MSDGKVILDLDFNKASLNKSFNEVKATADRSLGDVGSKVSSVGGGFKSLAGAVGSTIVKLAALTGSVVAVGAELKKVVAVGASFQQGMAKVAAISGATGEDLQKLTKKAEELGRTTQKSSTEVSDAFKYMAQAGWKTEEMLQGVDSIIKLSIASGEELASVSDIVTDALTGFGLQAQDTARFADVLAKTASNSNTNIYEMGESFKYVASTAGALGYSVEDTALAIGLLANNGIKGSMAGTALRTTFTRLSSASGEAKSVLDGWNISLTNADGSMKPLSETLTALRDNFSTLSQEQQVNTAKLLVGTEAMGGFLALMNSSDETVNSFSEALANANGEVERQTEIMGNTVQGAFERYKSALEGIRIAIFNELSPALASGLQSMEQFINGLTSSIKGESDTSPIDYLLNSIVEGSEELKNKLPAIISGLVDTAINFLLENAPKIVETGLVLFGNLAIGLIKSIPVLISKIPEVIEKFKNELVNYWQSGSEWVATKFSEIWEYVKENWKEALKKLLALIWDVIKSIGGLLKFIGGALWSALKFIGTLIKDTLKAIGKWILEKIIGVWETIKQFFKDAFRKAWEFIQESIKKVVDFILDFPNKISELFTKIKDFGKNLVVNLWNGIKEKFSWLKEKVTGFFSNLFSFGKKDNDIDVNINENTGRNSISRALQGAKSDFLTNFKNNVIGHNSQLAVAGQGVPIQSISNLTINFDKYFSKSETADEAFFRQAEFYRRQVANGKGEK